MMRKRAGLLPVASAVSAREGVSVRPDLGRRQGAGKEPHFIEMALEVGPGSRRETADHEIEMAPLDRAGAFERRDLGTIHIETHRLPVKRPGQIHPASERQGLRSSKMVTPRRLRHLKAGFAFEHAKPVARLDATALDEPGGKLGILRHGVIPDAEIVRIVGADRCA